MLATALKAGLPIIKVTTDDPLNYMDVLTHYVGGPSNIQAIEGLKSLGVSKYAVMYNPPQINWKQAYRMLMEYDNTLIVVICASFASNQPDFQS